MDQVMLEVRALRLYTSSFIDSHRICSTCYTIVYILAEKS